MSPTPYPFLSLDARVTLLHGAVKTENTNKYMPLNEPSHRCVSGRRLDWLAIWARRADERGLDSGIGLGAAAAWCRATALRRKIARGLRREGVVLWILWYQVLCSILLELC